jgi:hypothetical protein
MFPNFEEAEHQGTKVTSKIQDESFFKNDFLTRVSKRGGEII